LRPDEGRPIIADVLLSSKYTDLVDVIFFSEVLMRRFVGYLAVGVCFALSTARAGEGEMFFNGKDFAGWEGLTGAGGYWGIHDKAIVGITPNGLKFNTFLCSKQKYKDFELQFQVKLSRGSGNSGVQIRSHIHNMKTYAVTGPQCDMGQQYWGSLYGENFGGMMKAADANLVKKVLKDDDFNDYYIKCVGKHVTIKLNGETTVDDDFPKMPDEGIIAWQLHGGPPMIVIFRNIQFKEIK
jgi:Domain of Unknown Function (DUF1080)